MADTITVFEDYPSSEGLLDQGQSAALSSLKQMIGRQNCVIESNGAITVRRYVGFFCNEGVRLQILPKIYAREKSSDNSDEARRSLSFLYNLLRWSGFLSHIPESSSSQAAEEGDLVEALVKLFIDEFIRICSKSIHYAYEMHEEDLVYAKGKIMFPGTIQLAVNRPGFLHVAYDEFSIDNPLNRIFRATIRRLLCFSSSSQSKRLLKQGLSMLEEVSDIELTADAFSRIAFNRNNAAYEPLFQLARLFFSRMRPSLSSGDERILAFLIPINRLFERFVYEVLREVADIDSKVIYHSHRYLGKDASNKRIFKIEPDYVIQSGNRTSLILDAKYKNPIDSSGTLSVIPHDIYQICAYAQRYHCRDTALVYPRFIGQASKPLVDRLILDTPSGDLRVSIIQVDITCGEKSAILADFRRSFAQLGD